MPHNEPAATRTVLRPLRTYQTPTRKNNTTMARKTNASCTADFASLGLEAKLVETLQTLGYEEPTPIQREAIPPLLAGNDVVGQAATGTGKTAAFALPLLQRLAALGKDRPRPSILILVPTRELAMQVAEATHRYGRPFDARVLPLYGGQAFTPQLRGLQRGVDVVVATPGRALDHIRRETLGLEHLTAGVLDEADEMLDMGFAEDLEAILSAAPSERQTVLFSATLPPRIASIAKKHVRNPVRIQIAREPIAKGELPRVRQTAYIVPRAYKLSALSRVLDVENPSMALVFCRTRTEVDELSETLTARGRRAEALHGGMSQEQRTRVIKRLRGGSAELVIATDVAARGLDIEQLTHVVNYDVPSAPEAYVHRIGRVGRAGKEGVAITLAEPREHRLLRNFEQATKQKIAVEQVPTIADLRARRLELTRSAVRELLVAGGLDEYRVVVESLAEEFDCMTIALAAVKLAHQATGGEQEETEEEIPAPRPFPERPRREERSPRDGRRVRGDTRKSGQDGGSRRSREGGMVRLYIGAGRAAGVRPQDLVGAIAGEAGIRGRDVGAIDIADRFSLVEIPEGLASAVIKALRGATIKGKKVTVRRDNREG